MQGARAGLHESPRRRDLRYVRSAAHQPVHWSPWGADAFERAAKEDKPVLLESGAEVA
jgi:uncharacterized protein YyaL (SSP411 family)